jgi:hypothetical protein
MRIPNQGLGVVRQSNVYMHQSSEAIVPQARAGGLGGLGGLNDVWDCIICTTVCVVIGAGGVLECDQACRSAGCMGMLHAI